MNNKNSISLKILKTKISEDWDSFNMDERVSLLIELKEYRPLRDAIHTALERHPMMRSRFKFRDKDFSRNRDQVSSMLSMIGIYKEDLRNPFFDKL